jgi:anti-sigma factor RsiW
MNCKICRTTFSDLLLQPGATDARLAVARVHLAACAACAQELASLEATFALLDTWRVPTVSPYFDQKLAVRLREEQAAAPAGWFERLRDRLAFNTGRQFHPALTGALALLLIVGGGSFGIATFPHQNVAQVSPTVNDLKVLDKNEQALQQMDQLLRDDASDTNAAATHPQS